jgi:RsiW-degrading membrane proteinase PrsW (M82 family)
MSRLRRRRPGQAVTPPESTDGDPVQEAFQGRVDLYDIATWEPRSSLDSLAVSMAGAFQTGRTVLLIGGALLLFFLQVAVAGVIVLREPFIGVLAVLSMLPAFVVGGYLWYGDPTSREPFVLLAATFLLSVLFAGFAGIINSTVGPLFEAFGVIGIVVFYFLVVGPVEEFVKWLAIRVYAYRNNAFRTVVDGVVYGAAAGVGFAAIENLTYIVTIYLEAADTAGVAPTEAATNVAAQRFFVGPGHVVYSAWAGFYLGLAKFNPENRGPIIVKGLLIAVFIHALYNTSVTVLPAFLPGLAMLGFIILYDGFWFVLLYRKVRAYRELYRARFPDERSARAKGPGGPG